VVQIVERKIARVRKRYWEQADLHDQKSSVVALTIDAMGREKVRERVCGRGVRHRDASSTWGESLLDIVYSEARKAVKLGCVSRIDVLVRDAKAARSHELVVVNGRDALRLVGDDGTQLRFLDPDEVVAFRQRFMAAPEIWRLEGLPPCTWDGIVGHASGVDSTNKLTVRIDATREQITTAVEARLATTYAIVLKRRDALAAAVADRLIDLYNDTWRDGAPMTARAIAVCLMLETIVLSADPSVGPTLWYHAGTLFGGHSIETRLDVTLDLTSATLAG
jgi:hypothetical protein